MNSWFELKEQSSYDPYTYISFTNLNTGQRDIWRCVAEDDNDAISQFYSWCRKNKIHGLIVEIS